MSRVCSEQEGRWGLREDGGLGEVDWVDAPRPPMRIESRVGGCGDKDRLGAAHRAGDTGRLQGTTARHLVSMAHAGC